MQKKSNRMRTKKRPLDLPQLVYILIWYLSQEPCFWGHHVLTKVTTGTSIAGDTSCNQSLRTGATEIYKEEILTQFWIFLTSKKQEARALVRAWTAEGKIPRGQKGWSNFQSRFNPSQGHIKPFKINPTMITKCEWKQVFTSCCLMRPLVLPLRISFFSLFICFSSFAILSLSFSFSMSIVSCWIYKDTSWWSDCQEKKNKKNQRHILTIIGYTEKISIRNTKIFVVTKDRNTAYVKFWFTHVSLGRMF